MLFNKVELFEHVQSHELCNATSKCGLSISFIAWLSCTKTSVKQDLLWGDPELGTIYE